MDVGFNLESPLVHRRSQKPFKMKTTQHLKFISPVIKAPVILYKVNLYTELEVVWTDKDCLYILPAQLMHLSVAI